MLRKIEKTVLIFLLGVLILAIIGCGGTKKAIIGEWKEVGGDSTLYFYKDDQGQHVRFSWPRGEAEGDYKFIDNNTMVIYNLPNPGDKSVVEIRISKDRLIIFEPGHNKSEYMRVK